MRLLFYAINGVGLGHVRRLLLIAEEIRRKRPEAHILFLTNSAFPRMIEERGFPCVRIPNDISPAVRSHFPTTTLPSMLHDQLFLSLARNFSPDAIVFDSAWSGELLDSAKSSGIKTALILRKDTTEHMLRNLKAWDGFNLICVAHTEKEFASLGAPKRIISHLKKLGAVFAGPVVPAGQHGKKNAQSPFRILVTAGGGGWPTTRQFLDAVGDGLRAVLKANHSISAEIVTGPLFKGTLNPLPGSTVHRYLENSELLSRMRQSHLAIAQAGYNTCNDLVAAGLPALLVPAQREIESQEERARYFQKAGCARVVQCKPEAIRRAVEQLYRNRSSLEKMRKACASTLGRPGTPAIAGRIISLMPQVSRVALGRAWRLKAADFVVAKGTLSKKARGQLSLLRKRAGFLLLETGPAWLTCPESVKELRALVDAVALQLTRQQAEQIASGRMPTGLRVAITLLKESGPYFEFRIPTTPRLAKKMATVLKQLHREGCPQIQFYIASSINDRMLEKPLSEVRRFLLSSRGENARVYCSHTSLVPSEFPKGRLLYYQQEQMAREKKREQAALMRTQVAERKVEEAHERELKREQAALMRRQLAERKAKEARERKLLKERRMALSRKLSSLAEARKRIIGARREAERLFIALERSETVRLWHGDQQAGDALLAEMDSQLKELESRSERLAALSRAGTLPDELPDGVGEGLATEWCAVLDELKAAVRRIDERRASHLSQAEQELDALLISEEEFKKGKASGTTWRQLDIKHRRLTATMDKLWREHIFALDEERRLIEVRKRRLAEQVKARLGNLCLLAQEDIRRGSSERQECLERHRQEVRARSKSNEVRQYLALKRRIERLERRIVSFDAKISEANRQVKELR